MYYRIQESPIGQLLLTTDGVSLTGLYMNTPFEEILTDTMTAQEDHPILQTAASQLDEYFAGKRRTFDLPLQMNGTAFQKQVWEELCQIPYGATISYGELARRIGNPNAYRAVGLANGKNPISIIVPCHRVIGANRTLTGYGGGLERKARLLQLEAPGLF